MSRICCVLAIRIPGTTAEYWMNTDPRILATTLEMLEQQDKAVGG